MDVYTLPDEPTADRRAPVVPPSHPLLAVMVAGAWFGLPWQLYNSWAMGSPTLRREATIVAGGFGAILASATVLNHLVTTEAMSIEAFRYALIVHVVLRLAVGCWLLALQNRCYAIFVHYGGAVRNGLYGVVLGVVVHSVLTGGDLSLWLRLVLA